MFITVGHIAQIAMVKSAAASLAPKTVLPEPSSSFTELKRISPSGNHASGETGRSTWMIGSIAFVNVFDSPRKNPIGVPMSNAMRYPCMTRISESFANARMP